VERLHLLGYSKVVEINFGAASPDRHQANMRAYMWNLQKEWLLRGAIEAEDEKLASDLGAPGFHLKANTTQLVIESKEHMMKRGQASPDDGDAFALTLAAPVLPPVKAEVDEDEPGTWIVPSSKWRMCSAATAPPIACNTALRCRWRSAA
jgi:hypothetical protein